MEKKIITIRKESGEYQEFSPSKFLTSLVRSGLSEEVALEVLRSINLKEGMTTKRLYQLANKFIRKKSQKASTVYSVRRALLALGPNGFNFEKFIAQLMRLHGYEVSTGETFNGFCVTHEVDVVAKKSGHTILVECKFHNNLAWKDDVKTSLYVDARRMDLAKTQHFDEFWLVTNTRFTVDAETYGNCCGLKLKSPHGPGDNSLYDLIAEVNAHPIGCLTSLKRQDLATLISSDIFFVRDLLKHSRILSRLKLDEKKIDLILKEARAICSL